MDRKEVDSVMIRHTEQWVRLGFVSVLRVAVAEINDLAVTRRAGYILLVDRNRCFQSHQESASEH